MARRVLPCCEPYYSPFPSGHHWAHSESCPKEPGQKVKETEWIWTNDPYPEVEQERHETQAKADLDESGCPVHNGFKPWQDCPGCASQIQQFKERMFE